jgi:hypothetical protein
MGESVTARTIPGGDHQLRPSRAASRILASAQRPRALSRRSRRCRRTARSLRKIKPTGETYSSITSRSTRSVPSPACGGGVLQFLSRTCSTTEGRPERRPFFAGWSLWDEVTLALYLNSQTDWLATPWSQPRGSKQHSCLRARSSKDPRRAKQAPVSSSAADATEPIAPRKPRIGLPDHRCSVQPVRALPCRSPGGGRHGRVHLGLPQRAVTWSFDGSDPLEPLRKPSVSYHQPMACGNLGSDHGEIEVRQRLWPGRRP